MRILLLKNWRDLRVHKSQFFALFAIVALGIVSFVASISAYKNLFGSYQQVYRELKLADYTIKFEAAPANIVRKVKEINGVSKAEGRLVIDTSFQISKDNFAQSRLIGVPSGRRAAVNDIKVVEGRYFKSGEKDVVLLEKHFADYYHKKQGDYVYPIVNGKKTRLKVVGVASSPEYLIVAPSKQEFYASARRFAILFVPEKSIESYSGLSSTINEISLLTGKSADQPKVVREAKRILNPYGVVESFSKQEQPGNAALKLDLDGFRETAYLLPLLILIVAAFSIYISLSRLVRSQRREIGLAKALGYTNRSIVQHFLNFSFIIALVGSISGLILGQWASGAITTAYAAELGIPLVKTSFYPVYALQAVVISLIFCLVAAIVPALTSAKLKPAEAMHSDPSLNTQRSSVSFIERTVSRLGSLPFILKIPIRNLARSRRRTLYTIIGIIFAFVLTLASWSFFDVMDWELNHQVENVERWDISAFFEAPQSPKLVNELSGWPGVRKVEWALQLPATLKTDKDEVDTVATALKPSAKFHAFSVKEGVNAKKVLADGKIMITPYVSQKLGAGVGDSINVESPWGKKRFIVGATNEEVLGSPAFMNYQAGLGLEGSPSKFVNTFYLRIRPDRRSRRNSAGCPV
jgi:putative ABC transport system permease protein